MLHKSIYLGENIPTPTIPTLNLLQVEYLIQVET